MDLNSIGSICSILSLIIALFVAVKVYRIDVSISQHKDVSTHSTQTGNVVSGIQAGRDVKK